MSKLVEPIRVEDDAEVRRKARQEAADSLTGVPVVFDRSPEGDRWRATANFPDGAQIIGEAGATQIGALFNLWLAIISFRSQQVTEAMRKVTK